MSSLHLLRILAVMLMTVSWFLCAWTVGVLQNRDRNIPVFVAATTSEGQGFNLCYLDRWDYMMAVGEWRGAARRGHEASATPDSACVLLQPSSCSCAGEAPCGRRSGRCPPPSTSLATWASPFTTSCFSPRPSTCSGKRRVRAHELSPTGPRPMTLCLCRRQVHLPLAAS